MPRTGVRELYGSESLTQVMLAMLDVFANPDFALPLPDVIAYDDACHLLKFLQGKRDKGSTFAGLLLRKITFVVDRFHFRNHVSPWCKLYVNPKKAEDDGFLAKETNTEAAESSFAWLARSKHIFRKMNEVCQQSRC